MIGKLFSVVLTLTALGGILPNPVHAHDAGKDIARKLLAKEALPNLPGNRMTAVTVELAPGAIAAPHRHEAFLFVYVLEGRVRSRLGDALPVDYAAGDHWIEPPGSDHVLTQNLSDKEPVKLLVVFVGANDAKLTTSAKIGD